MGGPSPHAHAASAAPRPRWRRPLALWTGLVFAAWIAAPFAAAGTPRWPAGWLHLASLAAGLPAHQAWVARHNPALRAARRRSGPGTKGWDVAWNALFWPLLASVAVVAGLEAGGLRQQAAPVPTCPGLPGTPPAARRTPRGRRASASG